MSSYFYSTKLRAPRQDKSKPYNKKVEHEILYNYVRLAEDRQVLEKIWEKFSFKNKAVESQLQRFRASCRMREKDFPINEDGSPGGPEWYSSWKEKKIAEFKEQMVKSACHFNDNGDLMVPIGLLSNLEEELGQKLTNDKRDFDVSKRKLIGAIPTLRQPQAEALEIVKTKECGLIRMATGVGKTALGQEIIRHYGVRSLFIVPSERIFRQTIKRFEEAFGKRDVGAFGDGIKRHGYVTVAIYQSIFNAIPEEFSDYSLALFDECFPYSQKVLTDEGPIQIGKLFWRYMRDEKMPSALSFNEKTKAWEYKKIVDAFIKKPKEDLIKISISQNEIVCTKNHPFLTTNGWKKAEELRSGDLLIGKSEDDRQQTIISPCLNDDQLSVVIGSFLGDGHVQNLKNKRYRLGIIHSEKQKEYCAWKASVFNAEVKRIENNGYANKPAVKFATKCFDLDIEFPKNKKHCPQSVIDKIDARAIAIWFMDDGYFSGNSSTISTCSFDEESIDRLCKKLIEFELEPIKYFSKYFYIRFNKKSTEKLCEIIAPYVHESMAYKIGNRKCGTYKWDKRFLEHGTVPVSKIKTFPKEKINRKKGNALFDLTVEDNHNFLVVGSTNCSGVVAHNCHHIGAETFFEVGLNRIPNLLYRYGLTADEDRYDGGTILVHAAGGPVIYDYDAARAIRDKHLASPIFVIYKITKTRGTYIEWKTDKKTGKRKQVGIAQSEPIEKYDHHAAYKNWVLGNDLLTEKVAEMTKAFNSAGKSVLILVDEKEHGEKFQKLLPEAGFSYGGLSENDEIMTAFNKRELKTIIATSVLREGADTVPVDVLINLMGGTRPKQANGRALRNDPDENGVPRKPTAIIIDFDFPLSPVLHKHSELRKEVHKTYAGEIHEERILI